MKRQKAPEFQMNRSFETFRPVAAYEESSMTQKESSCFNGSVRVKKYRITVEEVQEPIELVRERVIKLWRESQNHHDYQPLQSAAKALGFELDHSDFGKYRSA